ncbi:MAG TPA: carbon monoxide dehydrogenase subunit G [Steroidobacteraceae bacterium]|jgi:hypothetical protein|nr:carbon monoxide dehydrogenase subunit G [Steroidobacteraceae bacterium]
MQMNGQQRIPAPKQRVWEALHDPEILRRSIPGCQTLVRESDERMKATAEIKIGPIGARFNANVVISDSRPPDGYTLTVEGQGGTVGVVKSAIKVQLSDDAGGTLLSYDVDAQIAGRLAQLGGPIIDATAKQLSNKFFSQFSAVVTGIAGTGAAAAGTKSASASTLASSVDAGVVNQVPTYAPAGAPLSAGRGGALTWMLAMVVAALVGYLTGHAQHGGESDWMGLAIGLLLLVVAAAGFEYGRRAAAPVLVLDANLLSRLNDLARR